MGASTVAADADDAAKDKDEGEDEDEDEDKVVGDRDRRYDSRRFLRPDTSLQLDESAPG
jgi:hypothetical protein